MRELGPDAAALHEGLYDDILSNAVDLVFAAGPLCRGLFESLPSGLQAVWGETAPNIEWPLVEAVRAGDVVMVKGSNGSRMAPVVAALKDRFGAAPALRPVLPMLDLAMPVSPAPAVSASADR